MRTLTLVSATVFATAATAACGGVVAEKQPPAAVADFVCGRSGGVDNIGNGPFDGYVHAAKAVDDAVSEANASLRAEIVAMADLFNVEIDMASPSMDALVAAMKQEIAAKTDGGLVASVLDVTCAANDGVAALAEATCERDSGCDPAAPKCAVRDACREMSAMRGRVDLSCTVPLVNITFTIAPGLTSAEESDFYEKTAELERHATNILSGQTRVSALMIGKVNGNVLFDPSPALEVQDRLEGILTGDPSTLDVDPECRVYVPSMASGGMASLRAAGADAPPLLADGQTFETLFRK